jgi:hypothetical protein
MSVNRIIERVAQNQVQASQDPKQKTEWKPEWSVAAVFTWGAEGPEEFTKDVFVTRDPSALEGKVFCVVKRSNHFPPRFETTVGEFHRGRVSTMTGYRVSDAGVVETFGAFTPAKGATLLLAAQTYIEGFMFEFVSDNEGRIRKTADRRRDQENGPGGSSNGAKPQVRTGKTERDRAKKSQRAS